MMTVFSDIDKLYGDSWVAVKMQAVIDNTVSAKFESVGFKIHRRQTLDDIVSQHQLLVMLTAALLDTGRFFKQVNHAVKTKAT